MGLIGVSLIGSGPHRRRPHRRKLNRRRPNRRRPNRRWPNRRRRNRRKLNRRKPNKRTFNRRKRNRRKPNRCLVLPPHPGVGSLGYVKGKLNKFLLHLLILFGAFPVEFIGVFKTTRCLCFPGLGPVGCNKKKNLFGPACISKFLTSILVVV